jgi:D-lactate dehydrogenase (cytochrome)
MNLIQPKAAVTDISLESMTQVSDADDINERYSAMLHDESKTVGGPVASISFPKTVEEVSSLVHQLYSDEQCFSVSSARTGLTGGAVPQENSHIVSLEKYSGVIGVEYDDKAHRHYVRLRGGTTLAELNTWLSENPTEGARELFFPVDPTETSASISGMLACNAAGARSFHYGATRDWVRGLTLVFPQGDILQVQRGEYRAKEGVFELEQGGEKRSLHCGKIEKPRTKNTLGYSYHDNIDLIDIIVGSEGTLGLITDVELWLTEVPKHRLFLLQFFDDEVRGLSFVKAARESDAIKCLAIEYCDHTCLKLIADCPASSDSRAIQSIQEKHRCAVFVEILLSSEEDVVEVFEELEELTSRCGASLEESIAGSEPKDIRDIKLFRHAIPETINGIIAARKLEHPGLHKIATDMAVPNRFLEDVFSLYREKLTSNGLEFALFGHAGNNHFHVNILPKNLEELKLAKEVYAEIASEVVRMEGAVSAEHGIGRIKKNFLKIQYPETVFQEFKKIKRFFDPKLLLNPGVLFDL